jgi:hypothetical protein
MRTDRLAVLAGTLFLTLAIPIHEARARSCIDHAYEHMDLERTGVFIGAKPVAAPPELGALDEALNSDNQGKGLLLWAKSTMGFGKFYTLTEPFTPDAAIAPWLTATAKRKLMTGCGYSVDCTPVLPGRYVFDQEHLGGERTSKGVDAPEVLVAPGRDRLELRFGVRGKRFRAEYAIRCAWFEWTPNTPKQCAKSVASPWPANVVADASSVEPEPAPSVAPSPSASSPPPAAPSTAQALSIESVPVPPPGSDPRQGRGCGSCAVGADAGRAPVGWGIALALGAIARRGARRIRSR